MHYLSGLEVSSNSETFGKVLINCLKRQGQAGHVVIIIAFKESENIRKPRNSPVVGVCESRYPLETK